MSIDNLTGQTLGQYQLLSLIGSGGMGSVYEAVQSSLNRRVAIKILSRAAASDETYVQRFLREAESTAVLEHPNIIPIYDFGVDNGVTYVVMRLLSGGSLNERIRNAGQNLPSLKEIAWLLEQLASALDYAHSRGIVHRDIKPSNVVFDDRGTPYILDFGIAKIMNEAANSLTASGMAVGTPSYMAPEVWRGEAITPAIDQYALGVVIYELVTGRLPFEGETPFALLVKHVNEPPAAPESFRPNLPAAAVEALNRALAKTPDERFPSALDFARAFAAAVQDVDEQPTGFFNATLIPLTPLPTTPAASTISDGINAPQPRPVHLPQPSVAPPPMPRAAAPQSPRRSSPWPVILAVLAGIIIVLLVLLLFTSGQAAQIGSSISENLTVILAAVAIILASIVLLQQRRQTSRFGLMQNPNDQMMLEMTKAIAAEVAKETSKQISLEAAREISREVAIEVRKEITKQFAIPQDIPKPATPPPLPASNPPAPTAAFKTFIQPIPRADRLFDIFLSYSRKDFALMCVVRDHLREHGLRVWTDEDLAPGTPMWDAAIEDAMEQSGCMVILLTPNTRYSEGVRNEIHYAKIHSVHIFSLLADGDEVQSIPYPIIGRQWVDIRNNHAEGVQKVVGAIRQHLGI